MKSGRVSMQVKRNFITAYFIKPRVEFIWLPKVRTGATMREKQYKIY